MSELPRNRSSEPHLRNPAPQSLDVGAMRTSAGEVHFCVWAPRHRKVALRVHAPATGLVEMTATGDGYFEAILETTAREIRYAYLLGEKLERPDPASHWQPEGVHAPSAVVDHTFEWRSDTWPGIPLRDYVIYELHVGAFTPEGTFDAAIARIPYLRDLGVTAVELMPVAACPGARNWGYDGVFPYAVQHHYGGPHGLKRFVDACHLAGIAVVLDVVYNHLGPEGNYLRDFGPYFTARHRTPWGEAINFDDADSGPVRRFFLQNALHWVTQYRIDALRLDATDTIYDLSSRHFLAELSTAVRDRGEALNRRIYTIAESAANDARWIRPTAQGGFGLDAQWNDDFHHSLRRTLTGEAQGYYADYPHFSQLGKGLREGFIYSGEYSAYRRRSHGSHSADFLPSQFVVCCQNHDQVGNRMRGDRLGQTVSLPALKLAAAWVLLSPYIPLLFMGEEYNETAPFPYFVHHGDPHLIEAVRAGRRHEFAAFSWDGDPPDPQDEATFLSAKINPDQRHDGIHAELFAWYQELILMRKQHPNFRAGTRDGMHVECDESSRSVWVRRETENSVCVSIFHFEANLIEGRFPFESGVWRTLLTSGDPASDAEAIRSNNAFALEPFAVRVLELLPARLPLTDLPIATGETRQAPRNPQV
ncbi:MAG: malto-oligosyltrehalose trehalohydrolase [Bryobacterales bacterium]|nr:malto-oligosyltrehalose trehalohydrolase [Bryobacterales bacterium]